MTMKEQLLHILQKSREAEQAFLAGLSEGERSQQGTFEQWSAKDFVGHANYWQNFHCEQVERWLQGEALEETPPYDHANLMAYQELADLSWEEMEAFAETTHTKMEQTLQKLTEDQLTGPSMQSETQIFWQVSLGTFYSHKLIHYSDFYMKHGRTKETSQLWAEWAALVAPLDASPNWQGVAHYNAACGLALAGDAEGALQEIQQALMLRPGQKSWARLDSDLALLHEDARFRELIAPETWWEAFDAGPQVEALADQFLRTHFRLKDTLAACPEERWREGEKPCLRPAAVALHIAQTIDLFSTVKAGVQSGDPLGSVNWEDVDASHLPSKEKLLAYLERVEERMARFLVDSDLQAKETFFPWTGSTLLSRALYTLRHTQHHLAELSAELGQHGVNTPDWQ
ncbi:MAG: DinB family protein [Anaerolineales bacterium]